MLSPLVGLEELARRTVGDPDGIDPDDPDGVRGLAALEDASWLVRQAAGRMREDDWPTAAEVPYPVRVIVLRAARRGFENPEATTTESISAGGISSSRRAEPNAVYLTRDEADECARHGPASSSGIPGLGTIALTRGEGGLPHTVRVPADHGSPLAFLAVDDYATPPGQVAVALLDKGPETVRVFPSVEEDDSYGGAQRRPGARGVDVPGVFMLPGSVTSRTDPKYAEDVSTGQDAARRYTLIGPDKARRGGAGLDLRELDAFSRIEWPVGSGQLYDVNGGVTHTTYPARLANFSAQLVAR